MEPVALGRVKIPVALLVILGFMGVACFACSPLSYGYLPPEQRHLWDGLWPGRKSVLGKLLTTTILLTGCTALAFAWWQLQPRKNLQLTYRFYVGLLVFWSVPVLLLPPLLSDDAYAYAAQAWLVQQGLDPYTVIQGHAGPFAEGVWYGWAKTTAVYPPGALLAQLWVLNLTGTHVYWSVVGMRILAVLGVAVTVALLPGLARLNHKDLPTTAWVLAANPLTIILLIGGSHNDALMIGALALALWYAQRHPNWVGLSACAICIAIAASFKQAAVLAACGIVLASLPLEQRQIMSITKQWLRVAYVAVLGGAVFLALSLASGLGLGWMNPTAGNPGSVVSFAPLSWVRSLLVKNSLPALTVNCVEMLSHLLVLTCWIWILRRFWRTNPMAFSALVLLTFGVVGTALQPWYLTWVGFFLALAPLHDKWRAVALICCVALLFAATLNQSLFTPISVPIIAVITAVIIKKTVFHQSKPDRETCVTC